jgi:RNA polymerase sigma-70 factor (ECF subfamily)
MWYESRCPAWVVLGDACASAVSLSLPSPFPLPAHERSRVTKLRDPCRKKTDAEVFAALKAGRSQALAILYDRHAGLVYGIACKKCWATLPKPEDLTQDIFLNLARSSFDPRRGSLRTYLSILARSRCLDRLRSWRNRQRSLEQGRVELQGSPAADPTLEQLAQAGNGWPRCKRPWPSCPKSQRQVLKMAYYEGMSQTEIAKQLDLPLGTVKARARRALLRLRELLGGPS